MTFPRYEVITFHQWWTTFGYGWRICGQWDEWGKIGIYEGQRGLEFVIVRF